MIYIAKDVHTCIASRLKLKKCGHDTRMITLLYIETLSLNISKDPVDILFMNNVIFQKRKEDETQNEYI